MSWVDEAFGSWYPLVYPHRDVAEAARLIEALDAVLAWRGRRVLDVGCGAGRHLAPLEGRGARVVGVDLSATLLREATQAREAAGGGWELVRGDMRALPFRDGSFDVATSFFTSFGYFDEAEDRRALGEATRVLAPGGRHVLDYLNREMVLAHPNRVGERTEKGYVVREDRRVTDGGRHALKEIEIRDAAGKTVARYQERVTLYAPAEVRGFLAQAGLTTLREWGGYDGSPFDAARSTRHVLVSGKEPA
ncbi:MAG: class I SAM-dependent methyltransferase [bacterium]